ncbi:MAG: hypothetical protein BM555_02460 [Crocinitomix sp. MedPE-SWsnd]|nr:MAG: hypothetical protein BM555_02460 [Crocinitomix sp. MedPE-SWsnd]
MERIDLHNYEAFFLDHLEGNLSEEGQAELSMFLSENPQLAAELEEIGDISELNFVGAEASLDKEFLKANPSVISALTVDDWMIDSVEGNLSESQQLQLDTYVSQNGLQNSFKVYQNTILNADESLTFGAKADLKRKDGFVIPFYAKWMAAAAIILLIANTVDFSSSEEIVTNNEVFVAGTILDKKSNGNAATRKINHKIEEPNSLENPFVIIKDENLVDVVVPDEIMKDTIDNMKVDIYQEDPIVNNVPEVDTTTLPKITPKVIPEDDQNISVIEVPTKENEVVVEEPFKVLTNRTGNLLNRDISFTRDRKKETDDYVAYHFKIGRFEFDRKKSK